MLMQQPETSDAGMTMTRMLFACSIVLAFGDAAAAAQAGSTRDRCTAKPGDYRRQCFIELGGICDPATGRIVLSGPSGGTILGEARLDACITQKRAQNRR
jgi:hypothetical protein